MASPSLTYFHETLSRIVSPNCRRIVPHRTRKSLNPVATNRCYALRRAPAKAKPAQRIAPKVQTPTPPPLRHSEISIPGAQHPDFPVPSTNIYARNLAHKTSPTTLYVNTGNTWFQFGRAALAGLLVAIGVDFFEDSVIHYPPGVPWFYPHLSAAWITTLFGGLAFVVYPRGKGPIGAITARPLGKNGLKLIVEGPPAPRIPFTRRMLWPPQNFDCAVKDVKVSNSVLQHQLPASIKERAAQYEIQKRQGNAQGIRAIPKAIKQKFEQNILKEKAMKILVNGHRWDLDVRDGWMLDNGQALDRLLRPGA